MNGSRSLALGILVVTTSGLGCAVHDASEPGLLVAPTVDDDPSLPALEVNGTRLHVEMRGSADAPVLLFLHGGPGGDYRYMLGLADEKTWLTHGSPSDSYRRSVYAGARTGWYGTTGRVVRLGIGAAVRLRPVEIALRGGLERTASLDFLPAAYGALSLGWFF